MIEVKRNEFTALLQEDMTMAEYHSRFLALDRFALAPPN